FVFFVFLSFFFFFFQAEDGIRDRTVTGVQTCALPISWYWLALLPTTLHRLARCSREIISPAVIRILSRSAISKGGCSRVGIKDRSEERRVGKECRCRWSQYD